LPSNTYKTDLPKTGFDVKIFVGLILSFKVEVKVGDEVGEGVMVDPTGFDSVAG
jgi:hypothetical protein